jgi:hypothetical protein
MIADFRSMKHLLITLPTAPAELATVCKYNTDGSLAVAGKIGIQFEGTPFELRNLRLAPLK